MMVSRCKPMKAAPGDDPIMSAPQARLAAARLLVEVLENRRTLDEALDRVESFKTLEGADRAFARAMASAALRRLGHIDKGLAPFLNRPLETAAPAARALLRIGAAQLWVLGAPAHAAVSETVGAAKLWREAERAAGFINAVLRKAAADRSAFDGLRASAIWPGWFEDELRAALGEAGADALAASQFDEPPIHLTAKTDPASVAAETGGEVLPSGSVLAPRGTITSMEGYASGDWWVQDQAATLPARLLRPQAEDTVIDLCAAPGGKTMQLAAMGAQVIAVDRAKKRLERLTENLGRTALADRVSIVAKNAETWRPAIPASKILLDAPCSALGTLRRHPEGAWIKRAGDVARYPDIQTRLLRAATEMLAPGGVLIYCVCTPIPSEGRDVVTAVLEEGQLARLPVAGEDVPGFADCVTPEGDLLTLPSSSRACDAFFISRLMKSP